MKDSRNAEVGEYMKCDPAIAKIRSSISNYEQNFEHIDQNQYTLKRERSIGEANIICAGQIQYDEKLSEIADFQDMFNFRGSFKPAKKCFEGRTWL